MNEYRSKHIRCNILSESSFTSSWKIGLLSLFQSAIHPELPPGIARIRMQNGCSPDSNRYLHRCFISWEEQVLDWISRRGHFNLFISSWDFTRFHAGISQNWVKLNWILKVSWNRNDLNETRIKEQLNNFNSWWILNLKSSTIE